MVPEGWEATKLGSVFKNRRERGDASLPTFSVTLNDGLVLRESLERKTETNLAAEEHLLVRKGDIAYNMMRMWQGASGLASVDAIVSPAYIVLEATKDMDPVFASYLFKSARMIYLFWAYSYGLTNDRLRLYYPDFALIPAVLPPIEEQRSIAKIIQTWDRAIAITERLIELNEKQKLALLQQLLSPSGGSFKKLKLKDMASVNQRSLDSTTSSTYSFRYISLSDVQDGRIASHLERHVFSSAPSRAQRKVASGDILMSTVRPNLLGFARVGDADADCIASTGFAVLTTKPEFDRDYLYHYLYSEHIIGQLNALVVGSNYPAINPSDVESLAVYCPPSDSQKKIGRILNNCDARRDGLHNQRRLLIAEKDALIQQLLTGRRRVKLTSEVAPTAAIG